MDAGDRPSERPHARLADALSRVPGSVALVAAGLMLLGAAMPWLRDPFTDDALPERPFGLPYPMVAAIGAGIVGLAAVRLLLGHRRLPSLGCMVVGAILIVAVGDLWMALDARSSDVPDAMERGALLTMLGALVAAMTGVVAIQPHPPGWLVCSVLAVDIGDVEYDRALPRRARLVLLLGPTLMILLPTLAIIGIAALMGDGDT